MTRTWFDWLLRGATVCSKKADLCQRTSEKDTFFAEQLKINIVNLRMREIFWHKSPRTNPLRLKMQPILWCGFQRTILASKLGHHDLRSDELEPFECVTFMNVVKHVPPVMTRPFTGRGSATVSKPQVSNDQFSHSNMAVKLAEHLNKVYKFW